MRCRSRWRAHEPQQTYDYDDATISLRTKAGSRDRTWRTSIKSTWFTIHYKRILRSREQLIVDTCDGKRAALSFLFIQLANLL